MAEKKPIPGGDISLIYMLFICRSTDMYMYMCHEYYSMHSYRLNRFISNYVFLGGSPASIIKGIVCKLTIKCWMCQNERIIITNK
jgi:hypothetical protein